MNTQQLVGVGCVVINSKAEFRLARNERMRFASTLLLFWICLGTYWVGGSSMGVGGVEGFGVILFWMCVCVCIGSERERIHTHTLKQNANHGVDTI
jgi:hypothetical protein